MQPLVVSHVDSNIDILPYNRPNDLIAGIVDKRAGEERVEVSPSSTLAAFLRLQNLMEE